MDVRTAVSALPEGYVTALVVALNGADEAELGRRLEIPEQAIPSLLRMAVAKLASLLSEGPSAGPKVES